MPVTDAIRSSQIPATEQLDQLSVKEGPKRRDQFLKLSYNQTAAFVPGWVLNYPLNPHLQIVDQTLKGRISNLNRESVVHQEEDYDVSGVIETIPKTYPPIVSADYPSTLSTELVLELTEAIEAHVEMRIANQFYQFLLLYKTHYIFTSTAAKQQTGQATGSEGHYAAAHSSTLPRLMVEGRTFGKNSDFFLNLQATVVLPVEVNQLDSKLDGSKNLRADTSAILNEVAQGDNDRTPVWGLKKFVDIATDKLESIDSTARVSSITKRICAVYLGVMRDYQRQLSRSNEIIHKLCFNAGVTKHRRADESYLTDMHNQLWGRFTAQMTVLRAFPDGKQSGLSSMQTDYLSAILRASTVQGVARRYFASEANHLQDLQAISRLKSKRTADRLPLSPIMRELYEESLKIIETDARKMNIIMNLAFNYFRRTQSNL